MRLSTVSSSAPKVLTFDANDVAADEDELVASERATYSVTIPASGDYALHASPGTSTSIWKDPVGDEWPDDVVYLSPSRLHLTAGSHTVEVASESPAAVDARSYSLELRLLPNIVTTSYQVGSRITPNVNSGTGIVADDTDVDRYSFTINNEAQDPNDEPLGRDLAVTVTGLNPCDNVFLEKDGEWYDFDCTSGFSQYFAPGNYVLDVFGSDDTEPDAEYTLSLREQTTSQLPGVTAAPEKLASAVKVGAAFEHDGDVQEYSITVSEDDIALADYLVIEIANGCPDARLLEPESTEAWSEGCYSIVREAQAGTYRLQVAGAEDSEYEYQVYLTDDVDPALWHRPGGGGDV